GPFIGNFDNAFFINVLSDVGPTSTTWRIPELVFAIFQGMFAAITPAIAIGSAAERAVAGLVAITPGSGYVAPHFAIVFGVCGGAICNMAVKLKHIFGFDDALDVFAVHGIGGLVGNILTGVFADKNIAALSGEDIMGGVINHNYIQLAKQLSSCGAGLVYSFAMTYIILLILNQIPFLRLRLDYSSEEIGTDESDHGESAYYFVEKAINGLRIIPKPMSQPSSPQETSENMY
ncbi:19294_t:CDS:2, partial [Racocetra fulgida]